MWDCKRLCPKYSIDNEGTLSSAIWFPSFQILLANAVQSEKLIYQMGVVTAFLKFNGQLEEEIYISNQWVCLSWKGALCLQAAKIFVWVETVTKVLKYSTLRIINFKQSTADKLQMWWLLLLYIRIVVVMTKLVKECSI